MSRLSRPTAVTRYIENLRRDNQLGVNGWKDKRQQHPGSQPLLSLLEQAQIKQTLHTPNAEVGGWNSRKVAQWISNLRRQGTALLAYKGVGTIGVPWSFGDRYPGANRT